MTTKNKTILNNPKTYGIVLGKKVTNYCDSLTWKSTKETPAASLKGCLKTFLLLWCYLKFMPLWGAQTKEIIYFINVKPSVHHQWWEFLLCFLCLSYRTEGRKNFGGEGGKLLHSFFIIATSIGVGDQCPVSLIVNKCVSNCYLIHEITCLVNLSFKSSICSNIISLY